MSGFPDNPGVIFGAEKGEYQGFVRWDFTVDGRDCILIEPRSPTEGFRWIWKAEFFQAFPKFDLAMLERGWWLAFMNVGNTFGCPDAMDHFDAFYSEMVSKGGFSSLPVLEGLSRGGLYIYNWAIRDPSRVGMLYADNPVCDFKSWPGGRGVGPGSDVDWEKLLKDYHFTDTKDALDWEGNPIDHLPELLRSGVPIVHVYGDADEIVPWEENTGIMIQISERMGNPIHAIRKPGARHHPHGPEDTVAFSALIVEHCRNK